MPAEPLLPRADRTDQAAGADPAGRPEDSALAGRIRVLLVDDDEDDVVLARDLLRDVQGASFEVDWTPDYDEGLRGALAGRYDVCLVDYRLGAQSGVDFVRDVRRAEGATPVILLTGQGSYEVDLAAMEAGAADFLDKPQLTSALLGRSIRYAIQQRAAEEDRLRLLRERAARAEAEAATRAAREQAARLEAEVAERRRAEAELSRAKQEVEAASRAKDRFLATLSHELRTPLTPVLAVVSRLEADPRLDEEVRTELARVRRNVELEARLIDDLLDLTRIAQGKLELDRQALEVGALLEQAIQISCAEESRAGRLRIETDIAPGLPPVAADASRLTQVFWNLLNNAVKFTPEGGAIRVRARREPAGDELVIEIEDTGIGIDPEVLPRLFDAFEQGDPDITRRFGGLGLGLAISHTIVEMHGGALGAASDGPGRGSTFTLRLPAQEGARAEPAGGEAGPAEAATAAALEAPPRTLAILLVEDHADTAEAMAGLLDMMGHQVTTAGTAAAALAAAAAGLAGGSRFDLVVSDLGLPDQSGLDLMRELAGRFGLRGIALSGYGMEEDVRQSLAAGFDRHLIKPVPLHTLELAIRDVAALPPPASRP
jgi:signal transduction histidine kinase